LFTAHGCIDQLAQVKRLPGAQALDEVLPPEEILKDAGIEIFLLVLSSPQTGQVGI